MSDPWVREAQQWVNATYAANPQYQPCADDGSPGNGTFHSFIMALQIELGLTNLSTNFGPTTLATLEARGPVTASESNANLCDIVRYALFCKGYWGGETPHVISEATLGAIKNMRTDMGLPAVGAVTPKIFKGLLSTDAYVVTSGGSAKVREIQRWLNGHYVGRQPFFIGPCDGHYSRSVQQGLMTAIQLEVGIPENQADGMFGPQTITALRANELGVGDSGALVQLFSAACVFNEGFAVEETEYTARFTSAFDQALARYVSAFQEFSALRDTGGRGDYDTWAQLLVSTGNPDRSATACDCITEITPARGAALHAAGYRAVGRYLDESDDIPPQDRLNKELQPGELVSIFGAGLRCFPISQYWGGDLEYFSFTQGKHDGQKAYQRATGYGFAPGTIIYFAVDYDALDTEITSSILPYFRGVAAAMNQTGNRYRIGVYGSRNVCIRISAEGPAVSSFVSGMSWGFSGNLGYPLPQNWAFNQIKEFRFRWDGGDFGLDRDTHRPGTDFGVDRVMGAASTPAEFMAYLGELFGAVTDRHYKQPYPSDDWDIPTSYRNALVFQFLRYGQYDHEPWGALPGDSWIEQDWMEYARREFGGSRIMSVTDPDTGVEISTAKLALAATNTRYGGWLGDLCELYGEWRSLRPNLPSGDDFCQAYLARGGTPSSFSLPDYWADVYGRMFRKLSADSEQANPVADVETIYQTFERVWSVSAQRRAGDFYRLEFGGTKTGVRDVAGPALDQIDMTGVTLMIQQSGEAGIDWTFDELLPQERGPFLDGFADAVARIA